MYNVESIAKWFIFRNQTDCDYGVSDEMMSNLKLQKLLYYAQGCTLALTESPLFDDDFQAWEHGPAVPSVYYKYEKSGIEPDYLADIQQIDPETTQTLENVYDTFGQFSAWKLGDMAQEETPWLKTPKNQIISRESIRKYFQENYIEYEKI